MIYPLKGVVQNYAWGGYDFIPNLLQVENEEQQPFAEYWLGVHPKGAAKMYKDGSWQELEKHYQVPFLLKILDVRSVLSIQAHPNKTEAIAGFAKEEEKGIPRDAFNRVFRDDNHKPELMYALSDFWLLHGFKSMKDINACIDETPAFSSLKSHAVYLSSFYGHLMRMDQSKVDEILTQLKNEIDQQEITDKNHPHYWAKKSFELYGLDRGIFSIYFFNLVYVKPGQAIYQKAGLPHAYLEGQQVEIMANSDNVFRAGLTPKHMDVELLLDHIVFKETQVNIIEPTMEDDLESLIKSPAKEFELSIITINHSYKSIQTHSEECYIVLEGEAQVEDQSFAKGSSFFVEPNQEFTIKAKAAKIARAKVPQ